MKRLHFLLPLICLLGVLLLATDPAAAHGYIVRSIPEDRATLERSPTRLQYYFSEDLEPAFSEIHLRDQTGAIIASGTVDDQNQTLLSLQLPANALDDGAYIVELRPAFASDGHVIVESRVFFVGDEVGGVQGQAASTTAEPLEVVWKALLFISTYTLFGAFVVYAYVFVPAWGSAKYPAGLLPPRLMTRLNRLVWAGLLLAMVANILALLQQTMIFFNVDMVQAVTGGLWQVVRIGSRAGDVWTVRMVLLALMAALHFASIHYRQSAPRSVRAFWNANVWLVALFIGAQAVNSHAAGSLVLPWAAVTAHWLHALSVAFWVGGIVVLVLALPVALRPYEGEARRQAVLVVMRRFSHLIVGAVLLVITTGIYNSANWFYTPSDVATTYGASLAMKLILVALLLFVGAVHHIALRPDLMKRFRAIAGLAKRADAFDISLRLESGLVVLALISAALLSATPIPEPEFTQQNVTTPTANAQVAGLDVALSIVPGGPGVNTFDVVVMRDNTPVPSADVELQVVNPHMDSRSVWQMADQADDGLFITANDAIDETGDWWTLLDVVVDGERQRAVFAWQISDDAAVIQSRPPSLINLLAGLAVLGAVGFVLYPALRKIAHQMDWRPATLVTALGGAFIGIVMIVGGTLYMLEQLRIFDETFEPPPQIINPVLPDAESLALGETLYNDHCIIMQSVTDFQVLVRQLPVMRDETLFTAIGNGWRDVPPCHGDLTDIQRWHIVNYMRTFRLRL